MEHATQNMNDTEMNCTIWNNEKNNGVCVQIIFQIGDPKDGEERIIPA